MQDYERGLYGEIDLAKARKVWGVAKRLLWRAGLRAGVTSACTADAHRQPARDQGMAVKVEPMSRSPDQ